MSADRSFAIAAIGVLALVLLTPLLGEGSLLHEAFAPLCHQMPERSPTLLGVTLPVCWRCLGVVAGFALVALLWRRGALGDRRGWPWLLALGLLDFALSQAGLVADLGVERLASGLCLGIALPLALRNAWRMLSRMPTGARAFTVR